MAQYDPSSFESRWQKHWAANGIYTTTENQDKPKYYVLDMFPYPSGAGLHVGHPLGYIASDIVARYKRLSGYNVLHPMGYDAFGLPAEQYAIQTGQHPDKTTRENIARYREQLDKIGFSFDWSREVKTCEPGYYKWTQWIFLQLFGAWYNHANGKAEPISTLTTLFEREGFRGDDHKILTGDIEHDLVPFTAGEWKNFSEEKKQQVLLQFRLAYLSEAYVNWCPAMGTVLANEEVKDGVSERGGHPVERKLMKQWSLRITAYSDRLLEGLNRIDWSESIKEAQRNWIGKSEGSSLQFTLESGEIIEVFTTRPDTIFGVSFITLAPEHELVTAITTPELRSQVETYRTYATNRSERERMADVKKITGQFTGAYVLHPFTGDKIPVWIGDYVLAGYGTGAVMGVPAHDSRDFAFASHFNLPVIPVVRAYNGDTATGESSYDAKEGILFNSAFLDGLEVKPAIKRAIQEIEHKRIGKGKTNYRLRDAIFGRQRYWGEPIPVYYKNGIPYPMEEKHLPLVLPEIDKFLPTEDGEPPLARAKNWYYNPLDGITGEGNGNEIETTTMPGWAGSSWYFLRYMDPGNNTDFASGKTLDYWQNVDLYLGGSEHATGHLLYSRFWMKFLYDLGLVKHDEPFKKLINQGMIQGVSAFASMLGAYGHNQEHLQVKMPFVSANKLKKATEDNDFSFLNDFLIATYGLPAGLEISKASPDSDGISKRHVPVEFVNELENSLDFQQLKESSSLFAAEHFIPEDDGKFYVTREVEKMSKSKWNVINPDLICEAYGADTLRLYEMFLGPLEQSKPWNTNGIEGVYRFLGKLWKLFVGENDQLLVTTEAANAAELKILHKAIKKITEDIEHFSFNTSVSQFMITVNELSSLKCSKREVLEPLLILLAPYAPHIAEELWSRLGNSGSIHHSSFPLYDAQHLVENAFSYPVSINGKTRTNIELPLDLEPAEVESTVLRDEIVQKWLEGKPLKKFVFVKGRIVNLVV